MISLLQGQCSVNKQVVVVVAGLGLLDCDHPGLASPGLFLLAGQSVMPAAKAVGPNAVGNAKAEHEVPGKRSLTCCAMEKILPRGSAKLR